MKQLISFLFYFFSPPPSGLGEGEAVVALNGLFSPLSLKEPDTCVHPKEVCPSSARAHSSSAAGTEPSLHGAEASNAAPASADGFAAAALSLIFF